MPKNIFQTVGVDLLGIADILVTHYRNHAYRISIEPRIVGYPHTPTLSAKRKQTQLIVELDRKAQLQKLKEWALYAKSCNSDVRIVAALVEPIDPTVDNTLRAEGIGLLSCIDGRINEIIIPRDQSVNLQLPDLNSLDARLRRALAQMYEKYQHSYWRECFDEACGVLEREAKKYLVQSVLKRTAVLDKRGSPRALTRGNVDRMTLGKLANTYSMIQAPTQEDSYIGEVLLLVFNDRNKRTHSGHKAQTEKTLRKNVGNHVWRILGALKKIYRIP